MPKLKRMFSYVREGFLMLFFVPAGAFCRHFSKKYRNLWLVAERGNDARDNGYRFYEYLRTMHPEVNAHYVITTDSADEMKIAALGGGGLQRVRRRIALPQYGQCHRAGGDEGQ